MDINNLKVKELKALAKELKIRGRSLMSADQLREAIKKEFGITSVEGKGEPLTAQQRTDRYVAQRGTTRLTARQMKRLKKKANKNEGGLYV